MSTSAFDKEELYRLLRTVPKGKVITYGTLAARLGNKAWARAVGNALHANPDGDATPCYKVVSAQGRLSPAYAFGGMAAQQRRLEADGVVVTDGRVDLKLYGVK